MNKPNKTLYKDVTGQYPAYIKPMIEIIEISVEKGFANSPDSIRDFDEETL